jgi:hypothetical protein
MDVNILEALAACPSLPFSTLKMMATSLKHQYLSTTLDGVASQNTIT